MISVCYVHGMPNTVSAEQHEYRTRLFAETLVAFEKEAVNRLRLGHLCSPYPRPGDTLKWRALITPVSELSNPWRNWFVALQYAYLASGDHTTGILMIEDDVKPLGGIIRYLESTCDLSRFPDALGFSAWRPESMPPEENRPAWGWREERRDLSGSLAILIPRRKVEAILTNGDAWRLAKSNKPVAIDEALTTIAKSMGQSFAMHVPSLVQHMGNTGDQSSSPMRVAYGWDESMSSISERKEAWGSTPPNPSFADPVYLPGKLAVLCCHFNPLGYRRPRQNYLRFLNDMSFFGVDVFTAEMAFLGQEFVTPEKYHDRATLIRCSYETNMLWQKERLYNLLESKIGPEYDKVAWIDADVIFGDMDWPQRTCEMLQEYATVQLFGNWYRLLADGQVEAMNLGVGVNGAAYRANTYKPGTNWASPGGAWAARRSVFPLYEMGVTGSGDTLMLEAFIGYDNRWLLEQMSQPMVRHFKAWSVGAWERVSGSVANLQQSALHLFHGRMQNRKYVERWHPFRENNFDPDKHVTIDENGLLAWTDEAPKAIREYMYDYLLSRKEDQND